MSPISKTINKFFILSGLTIISFSQTCSTALAAFVAAGNQVQNEFFFQHDVTWDFANGAVNPFVVAGPDWRIELESAAAGGGNENLELRVRHLDGPHPLFAGDDIDIDPSPMPPGFYVLNQMGLSRPPVGGLNKQTTLRQFEHPTNRMPHFDTIGLTTSIPNAGMVDVLNRGVHTRTKKGVASFLPILTGEKNITVKFRNGEEQKRAENQSVSPSDGNIITSLSDPGETRIPTSYEVEFTDFITTTTVSLAFPGAINEIPGRIDLDAGFQFFETFDIEIIAPLLLDFDGTDDLFIGVDLGQWLDFQTSFNAFDEFEVVEGTSEALPGYIFSTSPLIDGPNGEFLAANPQDLWTGTGFVGARINGGSETVPEPSSILGLLILGGLGVGSIVNPVSKKTGKA